MRVDDSREGKSEIFCTKYEDLVSNKAVLQKLFRFLDARLDRIAKQVHGRDGPTDELNTWYGIETAVI